MASSARETNWQRREKIDRLELSQSLQMLRALGFAPWAIEHYRQEARRAQRLPHEIVRGVAQDAARKTIETKPNRASHDKKATPRTPVSNEPAKPVERRAGSLGALMRRQGFQGSAELLSQCGFERWAVECYRRAGRAVGMLPHDLVRRVAESAAWHKLSQDPEALRRTNGAHRVPREVAEVPAILLRTRTN